MRAILVSVDYSDLLTISLPWNRHHFDQVTVVTSTADAPNVIPVCVANGVGVVVTDLFYADGARFNKFRALEHGLDVIGRHGWLCVMDADVLWPKTLRVGDSPLGDGDLHWVVDGPGSTVTVTRQRIGQLVSPRRRMWDSFPHNSLPIRSTDWMASDGGPRMPGEQHWGQFPLHRNDAEFAGYSQIFHADDPVLDQCGNCRHHRQAHSGHTHQEGTPETTHCSACSCRAFAWHDTRWVHAGGADSFFQARWSPANKVRPPFEVLHLGQAGQNWYGRVTPYLDGSTSPETEQRREAVRRIWEGRRGKVGDDRFRDEKLTE